MKIPNVFYGNIDSTRLFKNQIFIRLQYIKPFLFFAAFDYSYGETQIGHLWKWPEEEQLIAFDCLPLYQHHFEILSTYIYDPHT